MKVDDLLKHMPQSILVRGFYVAIVLLSATAGLFGLDQLVMTHELQAAERRVVAMVNQERSDVDQAILDAIERLNRQTEAATRKSDMQYLTLHLRMLDQRLAEVYDQLASDPDNRELLRQEEDILREHRRASQELEALRLGGPIRNGSN